MDNLPASIREIIDVVGLGPAMALVGAWPGVVIKVPFGVKDGVQKARFVAVMGQKAAEAFLAHYGGNVLTIPRCVDALRDERDRKIIAALDAGVPPWKLAIEHSLTERQIRTIGKRVPGETVDGLGRKTPVDDKQLEMF